MPTAHGVGYPLLGGPPDKQRKPITRSQVQLQAWDVGITRRGLRAHHLEETSKSLGCFEPQSYTVAMPGFKPGLLRFCSHISRLSMAPNNHDLHKALKTTCEVWISSSSFHR